MAIRFEAPSPTASWAELSAGLDLRVPVFSHLAPAEKIVARYLMEGLTNREIAVALGKAEATVKNQVSACLRKCNVPSRGRLVALMR
jgi:DNA-binding NarL/FixJ family response regulator